MAAEFELKCLLEGHAEVEDLEVLHQGDDLCMMNIGSHAGNICKTICVTISKNKHRKIC